MKHGEDRRQKWVSHRPAMGRDANPGVVIGWEQSQATVKAWDHYAAKKDALERQIDMLRYRAARIFGDPKVRKYLSNIRALRHNIGQFADPKVRKIHWKEYNQQIQYQRILESSLFDVVREQIRVGKWYNDQTDICCHELANLKPPEGGDVHATVPVSASVDAVTFVSNLEDVTNER